MSPAADPTDGPRPLVDSSAAAEALRTSPQQLHKWADTGIVSPARVDDDGARWWNLHDLRRQLATYLDEHPDEDLRR
jgi:hypothetical protein